MNKIKSALIWLKARGAENSTMLAIAIIALLTFQLVDDDILKQAATVITFLSSVISAGRSDQIKIENAFN
nr:hypothetical protein 16 [bacterium]